MFYNLKFHRPLSKLEEAQIHWLQSKMQQAATTEEKNSIARELVALLNKIDSDKPKNLQ